MARGWIAALILLGLSDGAFALEPGARAPALPALSAHRGKVVYVDFWASWCVPCRTSLPALDGLHRKYEARGLVVVGYNKDANGTDAERFLKRMPIGFPWVADADDAAARAFAVKAMPSGYLIDRKGVIRAVHRGFTAETAATLAREIEALLEEKP